MNDKVILTLVDAMRTDAIHACVHPFFPKLIRSSTSMLDCETMMPSSSLPCMASLFYSLTPQQHGMEDNFYKCVSSKSLFDVAAENGAKCALYGNFETLKNLARHNVLDRNVYYAKIEDSHMREMQNEQMMTEDAMEYIREENPDFIWLYYGYTDEAGHRFNHMGKKYLQAVANASSCIEKVFNEFGDEYYLIVVADHGGHRYIHGTDMPEDMFIPLICHGKRFMPGKSFAQASILDVAPTIADLLGIEPPPEWMGKSLFEKI